MKNKSKSSEGKGIKEKGLTAGIERWKVELSGLIYDMVNHRPSNLPHLKGLIPNFKDIEELIQYEINTAKSKFDLSLLPKPDTREDVYFRDSDIAVPAAYELGRKDGWNDCLKRIKENYELYRK